MEVAQFLWALSNRLFIYICLLKIWMRPMNHLLPVFPKATNGQQQSLVRDVTVVSRAPAVVSSINVTFNKVVLLIVLQGWLDSHRIKGNSDATKSIAIQIRRIQFVQFSVVVSPIHVYTYRSPSSMLDTFSSSNWVRTGQKPGWSMSITCAFEMDIRLRQNNNWPGYNVPSPSTLMSTFSLW